MWDKQQALRTIHKPTQTNKEAQKIDLKMIRDVFLKIYKLVL